MCILVCPSPPSCDVMTSASNVRSPGATPGCVVPVTEKWYYTFTLATPDVVMSVLGVIDPVSVYCVWLRLQVVFFHLREVVRKLFKKMLPSEMVFALFLGRQATKGKLFPCRHILCVP